MKHPPLESVFDHVISHDEKVKYSLSLVASENVTSCRVRRSMTSDLQHRYCIPPEEERPPGIWDYPNQTYTLKIARQTSDLACSIFGAAYADVRPLSGNQVAQIVLMSLLRQHETMWSVPADCGGHFTTPVIAARENLHLHPLPYDTERGVIDIGKIDDLYRQHPPRLIFLDASMQLFPHPVSELRDALGEEVIISFDASHTLGMIAGKHFQDPLSEGADLLHGSTHKSLWGPQKGMILTRHNDHIAKAIHDIITPLFVSNAHVHHIAALGIALEEAQAFAQAYAQQVLLNARKLASVLLEHGMNPLFPEYGFTECHQILIAIGDKAETKEAFHQLEAAGLFVNAIQMPYGNGFGLRLGLTELTRRGMKESEMSIIGKLIVQCTTGKRPVDEISKKVRALSQAFTTLQYVFPGDDKVCMAL